MKRTEIEEYELFCLCVEGGLATSTPEFIQTIIDKYKNNEDIRSLSLIKRLKNIQNELKEKIKND